MKWIWVGQGGKPDRMVVKADVQSSAASDAQAARLLASVLPGSDPAPEIPFAGLRQASAVD